MPTRVSLAELAASGVRLRAADAVAIVSEICRQRDGGALRGIPSAHIVRLTAQGAVVVEGPVNTDRPPVAAAAALLDELLENFDAPAEYRAPGALRLAVARALGTLDLPPYGSLDEFCDAIRRFSAPSLERVVRDLFAAFVAAPSPVPREHAEPAPHSAPVPIELPAREALTISDVRRARRATGLSLDEISARAHVPTALLRELEWGYLRNWPEGLYGRSQMVRYARAAGLDESVVISVAWPLLEEAVSMRASGKADTAPAERPIEALMPYTPHPVQPVIVQPVIVDALVETVEAPRRGARGIWLAAVAAAAMLAIAFVPKVRDHAQLIVPAEFFATSVESPKPPPATQPLAQEATTRDNGTSGSATSQNPARENATPEATGTTATNDHAVDVAAPQPSQEEESHPVTQPASYSPSFSNIGTAMFFPERDSSGSGVVRADTGTRREVLKITRIVDDNAQNFHVRPSPDGAYIAFDSDREGTRAVFVADADGHNVHRVSGEGFAAVPSWSPDGSQLAFVRGEENDPQVWNLWTTDLQTGKLQRLTSYTDGQPWGGSWFPDGTRIAYSHETELVVMNLDTGARRVFTTPVSGQSIRTPAVSPDGRRIIFQVSHDGAWLLDLRNGSMRRVLDDPTAEEYTWAPDGHRVAFHSHKAGGWGVYVMGQ
jgi:Helix-turn-helix domain/WD40-like Beta Propeller Repeat